jgi:hypothetical protein
MTGQVSRVSCKVGSNELSAIVAELHLELFKRGLSTLNVMRDGYKVVLNDIRSVEIKDNARKECPRASYPDLCPHFA